MEKDITGRAVEQSAKIIGRVMTRVSEKVPLGPTQVRMSREEMSKEIRKMQGQPVLRLAEILGDDEVMNLLRNR